MPNVCTEATIITSPSPASKAWRGPCGRRWPSILAPRTKCRPPRVRLAAENDQSFVESNAMPTYTIHAPPQKSGSNARDPERFVFVRDGFHFWAFAFGPLWLLLHRLWLAFVLYVIGYGLIGA